MRIKTEINRQAIRDLIRFAYTLTEDVPNFPNGVLATIKIENGFAYIELFVDNTNVLLHEVRHLINYNLFGEL